MADHEKADEYSQNSADQVEKQSSPAAYAEGIHGLDKAADDQQPAEYQHGADRGRRHDVQRDRTEQHHYDPQRQEPSPMVAQVSDVMNEQVRAHDFLHQIF